MLGNPPVPHFGRDPADEAAEQENYEVCGFMKEHLTHILTWQYALQKSTTPRYTVRD